MLARHRSAHAEQGWRAGRGATHLRRFLGALLKHANLRRSAAKARAGGISSRCRPACERAPACAPGCPLGRLRPRRLRPCRLRPTLLSVTYGMLPSSWQGTKALSTMGSPQMSASLMVPGPALVMMTSAGAQAPGAARAAWRGVARCGVVRSNGWREWRGPRRATRQPHAGVGGVRRRQAQAAAGRAGGPAGRGWGSPEADMISGMLVTKPLTTTCMPGG